MLLSAYDSVGYPNRGSDNPLLLIVVVVIMAIFLLGCCSGWRLRAFQDAFLNRMGQIRGQIRVIIIIIIIIIIGGIIGH